ncbi:NrfD/PsrC family molybdoenzyme membrane anchor subunit [Agriterribacter sp.]|uniref:NrfD/PsrC family molybdoenzyme membrane anchor subunit n=1 Tax=Agriterribacter sp. TaxID=2821509 RepID=UPI002C85078B|nr:NrfD/PsrC family molybdoenzyme membrane anchor subunit [Agriterribacter sp.]HTN08624.1 NrfD/PsrC family molybdoenzyme membrane anchor subunit [Agriterribacter sp.]
MSLTKYESFVREPLVDGDKTYSRVTEDIVYTIETKPTRLWYIGLYISIALLLFGVYSIYREVTYGVGQWNLGKTVGWGWDITNFVWWIGIGHAGTLISAILLLFRQGWRTGVNRAAEAMTIFAVMAAGQFPIWHMGRVWLAFFVMPYPNSRGPLWPNFNSPLLWDVFAISTYFTLSLLFWYSGLIPDVATLRDRAKTKFRKLFYGIASFGWTGSTKHWQRHESLSLVLAGLCTPLVLSVHTIVSFDFATSIVPGWHTTIFPPYFVAGAVFSGFAMVQTLMLITRRVMNLQDYITIGHIEAMNKVIVLTGSIVGCAYLTELFMAWYGANIYEYDAFFKYRLAGPYGWSYWIMMTCNVVSPQLFWFKKLRRNIEFTFIMSVVVNVGMWFERFVIIVTSIFRDYLPSSWSLYYRPSIYEIGFYLGTFGLFFTCYFLFSKYFPVIAIWEIKHVLKTTGENYKAKMKDLEKLSTDEFYTKTHQH